MKKAMKPKTKTVQPKFPVSPSRFTPNKPNKPKQPTLPLLTTQLNHSISRPPSQFPLHRKQPPAMSRLLHLSRKAAAAAATTITTSSPLSNPTTNNALQIRTNHYMSRLFPLSNTSFNLSTGNSLQADVLRLTDQMFLVDSGLGTPKTCLQDELIGVSNKNNIRFQNRVGYLNSLSNDSPIRLQILERFFIDLVAGDNAAKERALSRFNDLVGGADVGGGNVGGEPVLVLPRRYRQRRVALELNKIWRCHSKVKGFYVGRSRSGYAIAIAGFVAFNPNRFPKDFKDRFMINSFNPKTGNIVVHQ